MTIDFYKYQGTGNDFIIIDNRNGNFDSKNTELVSYLCHRRMGIGADGLMLLENHIDENIDFTMRYYNSDGQESSMCGNGGRCITAFAVNIGAVKNPKEFVFNAVDGIHVAKYSTNIVSLKMSDVTKVKNGNGYYFLDTGSPHYVTFCKDIHNIDVVSEGKKVRYSAQFKPGGTNVNFVEEFAPDHLIVRTYERGVEDETYSCGTGAVASAISTFIKNNEYKKFNIDVKGGKLQVSFEEDNTSGYKNIWLNGPAKLVFKGRIEV